MGQNIAMQVARTLVGKIISWVPLDDTSGAVLVTSVGTSLPRGATSVVATSGPVAAATAAATLAAATGKTTYISGFTATGSGATAASNVHLTISGLIGPVTLDYEYTVVAGVALGSPTINVQFNPPIPASAVNTAIVVTLPSLGSGNTNASVCAYGFQL